MFCMRNCPRSEVLLASWHPCPPDLHIPQSSSSLQPVAVVSCGDAEILDRGCENVSRRTLRLERQRDPATKNLTDAFASGTRSPHGARPPSISIWAASSEDRGKGFLRQAEVKSLTYISSILLSLWGNCLVKSLTCLRSHI